MYLILYGIKNNCFILEKFKNKDQYIIKGYKWKLIN